MLFIKFTDDEMVKRLRWVMAALIIFSMANTLGGQPAGYWHNPALAIRGDGLSINNPTNRTFEFFLGNGWLPFVAATLIYLTAMFLLASVLPRKLALVFIFSVIFAHYYGASNWLAVRWHLGMSGPLYHGRALASIIVFFALPSNGDTCRQVVKRTRWIMLFALGTDAIATLIGQPPGYWHQPLLVDEGNTVSKFFLEQGWYAYVLEQLVICLAVFWLVSVLSSRWALVISLGFIFGGFTGASNWFFYRWIWGWPAPVIFRLPFERSLALAFLAFPKKQKSTQSPGAAQEPLTARELLCKIC